MKSKLFKVLGIVVGVVAILTSLNLWTNDRMLDKRGVRAEVVAVSNPTKSTAGLRAKVTTLHADVEVAQADGKTMVLRRVELPGSVVKKLNQSEPVYMIYDPLNANERRKFEGAASDHWWGMGLGVFFLWAALFVL